MYKKNKKIVNYGKQKQTSIANSAQLRVMHYKFLQFLQ